MATVDLPIEIFAHIASFCQESDDPFKQTWYNWYWSGFDHTDQFEQSVNIRNKASSILELCKVNTTFYNLYITHLYTLEKKYLIVKYQYYNYDYVTWTDDDPGGPPQLLDALSTGLRLSYTRSTYNHFDEHTIHDIYRIVELMLETIKCNISTLRFRDRVPPLLLACINLECPIAIVDYLLSKGADPFQKILLSNEPITVFKDLKKNVPTDRYRLLVHTFEKYYPDIVAQTYETDD